jgi:hypothetical protein
MHQSPRQKQKHQLIEIGMKVFFSTENAEWGKKYQSGDALKEDIIQAINLDQSISTTDKTNLLTLAKTLTVVPDEERYGTMKLVLPGVQTDSPHDALNSIIRFKRPDAQDVPHTEDLLARLQGQANAARKLLAESGLSMPEQLPFNDEIEKQLQAATQDIIKHCTLDPAQIPTHRKTNANKAQHDYLKAQQEKSAFVMRKFSDNLANIFLSNQVIVPKPKKGIRRSFTDSIGLKKDSDKKKDRSNRKQIIKNQIYLKETELMSKKRDELVVIRPINQDRSGAQHIAVSIVPPVDPERTISSAKKDEQGLANFVSSENWVANKTGEIQDKRPPSLRSASFVPQDIFFDAKDEDLIREITRMNVRHHLLPALVKIAQEQGKTGNPLVIDYTLQTLLSPIASLGGMRDKFDNANPDYLQVTAIRDALNELAGRPVEIDGQLIQLNINYVNHGCNIGRGAVGFENNAMLSRMLDAENSLNAKGFNQIVDKNIKDILNKFDNLPQFKEHPIRTQLAAIPNFSEEEKKAYADLEEKTKNLYTRLDGKQMPPEKHARLTELHVKQKRHKASKYQTPGLTKQEKNELKSLQETRDAFSKARAPLEKEARTLEAKKEQLHLALYERRKDHFIKEKGALSSMIDDLEKHDRTTPETRKVVDHLRTLDQYIQLIQIGYDNYDNRKTEKKEHSNDNNKRNYQPQAYLHRLCNFTGEIHHKTCKSGKDRTNTAEEMEQALHQASIIMGKTLQLATDKSWAQDTDRQFFIKLYNEGYMHGNGNYICGQNMSPGAQQVSSADIPSDLDVNIWKNTLATFQKGAYKTPKNLDSPENLPGSHLNGSPVQHANTQAAHQFDSLRQLGHMAHALDQSITRYDADIKKQQYYINHPKKSEKNGIIIDNAKETIPLLQDEIKKLNGYREHIQLMQDITIKIALLDRQLNGVEIQSEQGAQLQAIREQLNNTLQKSYQEIQDIGKIDPMFQDSGLKTRLHVLAMYQNELYPSSESGVTLHMPAVPNDKLIQSFTLPKQAPPTINPKRSLNPKTEQHYVVQYTDLPPLDVTERLNRDKSHELIVTAKTDDKSKTLDPAILDQIVKIAQNTAMGPGTTIEVIAPNAAQALEVAIALKTAGIQPNVDSFDNGSQQIAFSAEAKAKLNAIQTKPKVESANEIDLDKPVKHVGSALQNASKASKPESTPTEDPKPPTKTRRNTLG